MENKLYEIVEVCPYCGHENAKQWDVETMGFVATCDNCGEKILLCDECMHREDNKYMRCDWCDGKCFRGTTKNCSH